MRLIFVLLLFNLSILEIFGAICLRNQHVSGGACVTCTFPDARPAGDDTANGDTTCTSVTVSALPDCGITLPATDQTSEITLTQDCKSGELIFGSSNKGTLIINGGGYSIVASGTDHRFIRNYDEASDGTIASEVHIKLNNVNIDGFQGGTDNYGGAFKIDNTWLEAKSCSFTRNHANWRGGVIRGGGNSLTYFEDCEFAGNRIGSSSSSKARGGIFSAGGSSVRVIIRSSKAADIRREGTAAQIDFIDCKDTNHCVLDEFTADATFAEQNVDLKTDMACPAAGVTFDVGYKFTSDVGTDYDYCKADQTCAAGVADFTIVCSGGDDSGGGGGGGSTCSANEQLENDAKLHIALGTYGRISTSSDLVKWSTIQLTTSNYGARQVFELTDKYVAFFRYSYTTYYTTSTDGGVTWSALTEAYTSTKYPYGKMIYANGLWIAPNDDGLIYTATAYDGTWTEIDLGTTQDIDAVAASDTTYVVVGASGTIFSSTDGATWTSRTAPGGSSSSINDVTYANGLFVAAATSGKIYTSSDGETWVLAKDVGQPQMRQCKYLNEYYICVGDQGYIAYSSDGTSWSYYQYSTDYENLYRLYYADGKYIFPITSKGNILTLTDITDKNTQQFIVTNLPELFRMITIDQGSVCVSCPVDNIGDGSSCTCPVDQISRGNLTISPRAGFIGNKIMYSPDGVTGWTEVKTEHGMSNINDVIYANNRYVGIYRSSNNYGRDPEALVSFDGQSWTKYNIQNLDYKDPLGITWDGEKFMVVGSSGLLWTSVDAKTWTLGVEFQDGVTNEMYTIVYENGLYITTGSAGVIYTSTTGDVDDWTLRASGTAQYLKDVTYGNGLYVIIGNDATILTSPDGMTWTAATHTLSTSNDCTKIEYWNGTFVGRCANGYTMSSQDGISWTRTDYGNNHYMVDYLPQMDGFLMSQDNKLYIVFDLSKTDKKQLDQPITDNVIRGIAHKPDTLEGCDNCPTGSGGDGTHCLTCDATYQPFTDRTIYDVIVGVAGSGKISISTDAGKTWSTADTVTSLIGSFNSVDLLDNKFVAMQYSGGYAYVVVSSDGYGWTEKKMSTTYGRTPQHVAYGGGKWVVVCSSGYILYATDPSGTWTEIRKGSNSFLGVHYANGQFVAVGQSGTVYTSPDGETWTSRTTGVTHYLRKVFYYDGKWIAVASSGKMITSTDDGVSWTDVTTGNTKTLYQIKYLGGNLVVPTSSGQVLYSKDDGVTWATTDFGLTTNAFYDIEYIDGKYFVVATYGYVYTFTDPAVDELVEVGRPSDQYFYGIAYLSHLESGCDACPAEATGDGTHCNLCLDNNHIVQDGAGYKCSACVWGGTRTGDDLSSNAATECIYPDCAENYHVRNAYNLDVTVNYGDNICDSVDDCETKCNEDLSCVGYNRGIPKLRLLYGITYVIMSDKSLKAQGGGYLPNKPQSSVSTTEITDMELSGVEDIAGFDSDALNVQCMLTIEKTVKCWGKNTVGGLGNGATSTSYATELQDVDGLTDVKSVHVGYYMTGAIKTDGTVWMWGAKYRGMLMIDYASSQEKQKTPVQVPGITNAKKLCLGYDHSCVLLTDGTLKCSGRNDNGQVGVDSADVAIYTPTTVATNVVDCASGKYFGCLVLDTGDVQCWGYNQNSQLGQNAVNNAKVRKPTDTVGSISGATKIDCGSQYCCVVHSGGKVACWGEGSSSRLGDASSNDNLIPADVENIDDAVEIQTGYSHTCAVRRNGNSKCWGEGADGRLWTGTTTDQPRAEGASEMPSFHEQFRYGSVVAGKTTSYTKDRACHPCENGGTLAAGLGFLAGPNTYCTCGVNAYVSNGLCKACPTGSTNAVGDDSSGADTRCDICDENYHPHTDYIQNQLKYGSTSCTNDVDCKSKCRADSTCGGYSDNSQFRIHFGYQHLIEMRDGKCTATGQYAKSYKAGTTTTYSTPQVIYEEGCTDYSGGSYKGCFIVYGELKCVYEGVAKNDEGPLGVNLTSVSMYGSGYNNAQFTICVIDTNGKLYCKEDGASGKLGQSTQYPAYTEDSTEWVTPLKMDRGVTHVDVYNAGVSAIKDGTLWTWGSSSGTPLPREGSTYVPEDSGIQVKTFKSWISGTNGFNCYIDLSDDLYCYGQNKKTGLMIGSTFEGQSAFFPPGGIGGDCPQTNGDYCRYPTKMNTDFKVRDVYTATSDFLYAITTEGKIMHYGKNAATYNWRQDATTIPSTTYFFTWKDIGETNALRFMTVNLDDTNKRSICYIQENGNVKCKGHSSDLSKGIVTGRSSSDPFTDRNVDGFKDPYTWKFEYGPKISGSSLSYYRDTSCKACESGYIHTANTPHGTADTTCSFISCSVNQRMKNGQCVPCEGSSTRAAGDNDPSVDTYCKCAVNQHPDTWYARDDTKRYSGTKCSDRGSCETSCSADESCKGYSAESEAVMLGYNIVNDDFPVPSTEYFNEEECKNAVNNLRHIDPATLDLTPNNKARYEIQGGPGNPWYEYETYEFDAQWEGVTSSTSKPPGCYGLLHIELYNGAWSSGHKTYHVYYNVNKATTKDCSPYDENNLNRGSSYAKVWKLYGCIRPFQKLKYGPLVAGAPLVAESYTFTIGCRDCESGRSVATPYDMIGSKYCDLDPCAADERIESTYTSDKSISYEQNSCTTSINCEELCNSDDNCEGFTMKENWIATGSGQAAVYSTTYGMVVAKFNSTSMRALGRWQNGALGPCSDSGSQYSIACYKNFGSGWSMVTDVTLEAGIIDMYSTTQKNIFFYLNNNKIFSMGFRQSGIIGDGNDYYSWDKDHDWDTPYEVMDAGAGARFVKKYAQSQPHQMCIIKANKELWCWGKNYQWLLSGDEADEAVLTAIKVADDVVDASLAQKNLCIVNTAGEVLCRGDSYYGITGIAAVTDTSTTADWHTIISSGATQVAISARYSACALKTDGSLKCWGRKQYCSFLKKNVGANSDCDDAGYQLTPVDYESIDDLGDGDIVNIYGRSDGFYFEMSDGSQRFGPTVGYGTQYTRNYNNPQFSYTGTHMIDIDHTTGKIEVMSLPEAQDFVMHEGSYGQLQYNSGDSYTRSLSCSACPAGTVNVAGDTFSNKKFSSNTGCDRTTGCLVDEFVALDSTCESCPAGTFNKPGDTESGTCDDKEICKDNHHVKIVWNPLLDGKYEGSACTDESDCKVKCGGDTSCIGYSIDSDADITIGDPSACTLNNGAVHCWGDRAYGRLGDGYSSGSQSLKPPSQKVETIASGAKKILCSDYVCLVLMDDGSVKCWGRGSSTKTCSTSDQSTPYTIPDLTNVQDIALATEDSRACALMDGGSVKCWGSKMGGNANPTIRLWGPLAGDEYVALSLWSGYTSICAILANKRIKCSGRQQYHGTNSDHTNWNYVSSSYIGSDTTATPIFIADGYYVICVLYDRPPVVDSGSYRKVAGNLVCGTSYTSYTKLSLRGLSTQQLATIATDSETMSYINCKHSYGCFYIANGEVKYFADIVSNQPFDTDPPAGKYFKKIILRTNGMAIGLTTDGELYGFGKYLNYKVFGSSPTNSWLDDAMSIDDAAMTLSATYSYGTLGAGKVFFTATKLGACSECLAGSGRAAGDDSGGAATACGCLTDNHVVNNVCTTCPTGSTRPAGDDAGGANTYCICGIDQHVSSNVCTTCPSGTTRPAGDDSGGDDTVCLTAPCAKDYHVVNNVCVSCPAGKTNEAGDTNANGDTYCDSDEKCQENEKVVNQACTACPTGKHNMPGDEPHGPDTSCSWNTCAKDEYSDGTVCKTCLYGTFNEAGDPINVASTCDADDVCETNEHISYQFLEKSDQQITNTGGYSSAITDFNKAQRLCIADSTCKGLTKDASDNYYLSDGTLSANSAYDAF